MKADNETSALQKLLKKELEKNVRKYLRGKYKRYNFEKQSISNL